MSKKHKKSEEEPPRHPWRKWIVLGLLLVFLMLPYCFLKHMDLPGTSVIAPLRAIDPAQCKLLLDVTAYDPASSNRVIRQEIFDQMRTVIARAEQFIYVDFFLWNGWQGSIPETHRKLAAELAQALIQRKTEKSELAVLALTDPINRIYGSDEESFYTELAAHGIPVIFTDLDRVPASNLGYSPFEKLYWGPLSRLPGIRDWFDGRAVKNFLDPSGPKVTRRQFMKLLNFRANHRKVLIADQPGGEPCVIVASMNPADGSSAHSNIGLLLQGDIARDALASEIACADWSAQRPGQVLEQTPGLAQAALKRLNALVQPSSAPQDPASDQPSGQWLTEGGIRARVIALLAEAGPGDQVAIGLFYLSDRDVVRAIAEAAEGGATVRLILDANRDAFGRVKNGVPNRPVAAELLTRAGRTGRLFIRWASTHGEQFHTKAIAITNPQTGKHQFLCGSANWTRRNLQNLNLEACVYLEHAPQITAAFTTYFDRAWNNLDGLEYTLDYEAVAESGWTARSKAWLYRLQEATGLSTF